MSKFIIFATIKEPVPFNDAGAMSFATPAGNWSQDVLMAKLFERLDLAAQFLDSECDLGMLHDVTICNVVDLEKAIAGGL